MPNVRPMCRFIAWRSCIAVVTDPLDQTEDGCARYATHYVADFSDT